MKEHICVLILSNLNVCDIPVSMKPSYLVAPVHIIDFYIHRDFEALSAWAVTTKVVSQGPECWCSSDPQTVKEYEERLSSCSEYHE